MDTTTKQVKIGNGYGTIPVGSAADQFLSSNVITPTALQSQPALDLTGTQVTPKDTSGIVAGAATANDQFNADYQRYLDLNSTPGADQTLESLLGNLNIAESNLGGKGATQTQYEQNSGIPGMTTERATVQGNIKTAIADYNQVKNAYEAGKAKLEAEAGAKGITRQGVLQGQQGALDRQAAIELNTKAANIAILQSQDQALAGNIQAAQDNVNRAVDALYADREAEYQTRLNQYNRAKVFLDSYDKKRSEALQYALEKEEKALADKKEEEKSIFDIGIRLAENGADPNMVIGKAKTKLEALSLAKNALQKKDVELKEINGALYAVDKNTLKVKYIGGGTATGGTGKGVSGAYGDVINTIIGSGKFTKDQANAIRNSISNGEEPFVVVKNQAKGLMTGANQTKVENYETAQKALRDIQSQLKEFYANGGNTNIFRGNYEKAINRLGEISDPNLVDLATQIQTSLQVYRNAVSGTAYSVQEGRDIASIFPGINKSEGLNTAILNGRMKAFESTIDGAYEGVLGQKTYQEMKKATIPSVTSKGTMSDRDYVEKVLVSNNIKYDEFINTTPQGQIPVIDNSTGQIGYIPYTEFNSSKYTKI